MKRCSIGTLILLSVMALAAMAQRPEPEVHGVFDGDEMYTLLEPDAIPAMIDDGRQFTLLARGLNIVGGCGFFLAGLFFIRRFHQNYDITDWLFAIQTTLFGAAGILFEISTIWDVTWWWWHTLRAIAYGSAFVVAVRAYLSVE